MSASEEQKCANGWSVAMQERMRGKSQRAGLQARSHTAFIRPKERNLNFIRCIMRSFKRGVAESAVHFRLMVLIDKWRRKGGDGRSSYPRWKPGKGRAPLT